MSAVVSQQRAARTRTPEGAGSGRPGRILGLDGVRAVAVLAVLAFHLRPDLLRGGYLGVDIFFVVSGFLITTLLLRELAANGRLDLRGFWTRRARRLLPALALVVVVSTLLGLVVGNDLLVDIRRQVLGALTFSNNWLEIAAGSSYFTQTAPQLFVNFWSLAVEEQFYLLWPVLLALLMAATRTVRQRVAVVLAVAAVSAGLMALLAGGGVTRVYYGTDTHAFGLMLGAGLALGLASGRIAAWSRVRLPIAVVSTIGLVVLLVTLDGEGAFAYRGGIVLASALAAGLIGALATAPGDHDVLVRLLSWRPLVWLGERSYGIYLWHWPVLLVVTAVLPAALPSSPGGWLVRGLALTLTLLAAAASYRFLEQPIRRDGFRRTVGRVRAAVGRRGLTPIRVGAGGIAAALVVFVAALVVAPDKSQVELQMEAAAEAVDGGGEPGGSSDAAESGEIDSEQSAPESTPKVEAEDDAESGDDAETGDDEAEDDTGEGSALPAGEDISSFGDSMLYVAAPALKVDFPGIEIDAESNRQWPDVVDAIETALEEDSVRDVVVIAAGTNAGLQDPAPLEEALELLGPDRFVVLVNIYHGSSWIQESNENMADVAAEHPNVVVADWYGTITEHLDQLQPDGVHPDMDGMYLFSDVVAEALAQDPR